MYNIIMDKMSVFDFGISVFVSMFALIDIQNVISIVILCLQCAFIIFRMCMIIYDKVKKKKYDEIDDVIEDTIGDLEDLNKKEEKKEDGKE